MDTVRGSGDFKFGRSWGGDYDGGDLGSVVRASRVLYSADFDRSEGELIKDENLFNGMFTRSECLTSAMVGRFNEHVLQKTESCFESQKAEINDHQIIPFCTKKLEPLPPPCSSGDLSALPMSVNLKSHDSNATVEESLPKEAECTSSAIRTDSNGDGLTLPKIPGTKRRKSQQRRIMCVPAAGALWNKQGGVGVPSDLWAWRKYGQKPIKGSPHPRGYYRCSSSKGCPARKQIERSHTDPTMLVITYTADHNHAWPTHRNALAGSTRQNAFHHKLQTLPVPNTNADKISDVALETQTLCSPAKDYHPDPNLSPIDESEEQKRGPGSTMEVNSLDLDQSDAGFDMFNRMHDDDLFADLGELPDCLRDFTTQSDEETTVVDPYSLFDWSTSTME